MRRMSRQGGERGRREWLRKTNFSNGSGNGNVNKTPSTAGRAGQGRAGLGRGEGPV